ncbi:hypothetical protein RSSM_03729 [Rhodopirellula sallentina SM41]|uniref:Uncharacterized protein n=1 Tax=Rhodopirellula sallentina SM41 TaxID=1263870 RepID=M5U077_9BACT|nr:hypothetical protein RSSM_03729 [Rhodopirellula sallentina SM41]
MPSLDVVRLRRRQQAVRQNQFQGSETRQRLVDLIENQPVFV